MVKKYIFWDAPLPISSFRLQKSKWNLKIKKKLSLYLWYRKSFVHKRFELNYSVAFNQ